MKSKRKLMVLILVLCLVLSNVALARTNTEVVTNIPQEMYDYVEEQYHSLTQEEKERLLVELCNEKYAISNNFHCVNTYSLEDETDIAYQNMLDNEQYIVDIIKIKEAISDRYGFLQELIYFSILQGLYSVFQVMYFAVLKAHSYLAVLVDSNLHLRRCL